MRTRRQDLWLRASLVPACLLLVGQVPSALAAPAQHVESASFQVAGWSELIDALRTLPEEMLAKLPPEERSDPQIQQEVGRLVLAALTSSALTTLNGDGDHPAFVPVLGQVLNMARPNADTIYLGAEITPGGAYRLRGRRGNVAIAKIGEGGASRNGVSANYHDLNTLSIDSEGRYDVILSPERPAGYTGDWWQSDPETTRLTLRMVSSDWHNQTDPSIAIERIDRRIGRPRPSASELEQRLRRLPPAITMIAGLRMGWISKLRDQGYLNKFKVMNYTEAGLLRGQTYFETAYDLRSDEALIIETSLPHTCGYRSLILTNEMGSTIDWTNNHSSLNTGQALPDKDGVLRVVVSAKDPGVPNWLDTAGYSQGGIQGRWTDCSSQPVPSLRKVAFADVRRLLPSDTPSITPVERETIVRERRAAFQQRKFW